jgi:hypothetical protein
MNQSRAPWSTDTSPLPLASTWLARRRPSSRGRCYTTRMSTLGHVAYMGQDEVPFAGGACPASTRTPSWTPWTVAAASMQPRLLHVRPQPPRRPGHPSSSALNGGTGSLMSSPTTAAAPQTTWWSSSSPNTSPAICLVNARCAGTIFPDPWHSWCGRHACYGRRQCKRRWPSFRFVLSAVWSLDGKYACHIGNDDGARPRCHCSSRHTASCGPDIHGRRRDAAYDGVDVLGSWQPVRHVSNWKVPSRRLEWLHAAAVFFRTARGCYDNVFCAWGAWARLSLLLPHRVRRAHEHVHTWRIDLVKHVEVHGAVDRGAGWRTSTSDHRCKPRIQSCPSLAIFAPKFTLNHCISIHVEDNYFPRN